MEKNMETMNNMGEYAGTPDRIYSLIPCLPEGIRSARNLTFGPPF